MKSMETKKRARERMEKERKKKKENIGEAKFNMAQKMAWRLTHVTKR